MTFRPGENVGPYRIIEQLGQGGMATVFKAHHANLDRYVAIKVLHAVFKEDPLFEQRFEREAKVIAQLEHPNIVPVYDFDKHNGSAYLVMRFVEGQTLKARLAEGPLSREDASEIVRKVGDALSHAHAKGILHRDVKPSNIILTGDGRVFLADFGLARIAQSGESTLSRDMMLGTPAYISPEQARGDDDLDPGTDIYSMGVVLYEIAVGRVPFSADTPYAVIHDHIFSPLPTPHSINPNVPEPVERVLLKALAKDSQDRYPSASQLADAFVAGIQSAGVETLAGASQTIPMPVPAPVPAQDTPPDAQARPRRKRRLPLILAGAGLLAVVCLLAFSGLGSALKERRAERELAAAGAEPPPGGACAENGLTPWTVDEARLRADTYPDNACAHLELAMALADADAGPEALQELETALNLGLSGETLMVIGNALIEDESYVEAANVFGVAYADAGIPEAEAFAFFALGETIGTPEGRATMQHMVETYPLLAFPRSALAIDTASQGNLEQAERSAVEAITLQPESPVAHYAMGLLFMETDRAVKARLQFTCVLRSLDTPAPLVEEVEHLISELPPVDSLQLPDGDGELPRELLGCAPNLLGGR